MNYLQFFRINLQCQKQNFNFWLHFQLDNVKIPTVWFTPYLLSLYSYFDQRATSTTESAEKAFLCDSFFYIFSTRKEGIAGTFLSVFYLPLRSSIISPLLLLFMLLSSVVHILLVKSISSVIFVTISVVIVIREIILVKRHIPIHVSSPSVCLLLGRASIK